MRALAPRADGAPWRIGIDRRSGDNNRAGRLAYLNLTAGALATLSPAGFNFGGVERHHHLFDVGTGASAVSPRPVTVRAPTTVLADGLSTAFSIMPRARANAVASLDIA